MDNDKFSGSTVTKNQAKTHKRGVLATMMDNSSKATEQRSVF